MIRTTFPTLYHKGKKDVIYSWQVWAEDDNVWTDYGVLGGKRQKSCKRAEAKNVGRTNATTPEEQAAAEAKSLWKHKRDRKYFETPEEAAGTNLMLPMLAKDFTKRKGKVVYPVDVQPKLNGLRCLVPNDTGIPELISRAGKTYEHPRLVEELRAVMPTETVLDGELYIHGESLQTITSYIKRLQDDTNRVKLYVYDLPRHKGLTGNWEIRRKRLERLKEALSGKTTLLRFVPSKECFSEKEVYETMAQCVANGYEGAIVRMRQGDYLWGYRSSALLKVKDFQDDEYEIVDFEHGKGKFRDAVIWVCKTSDDKLFRVVPRGSMEYRRQLYAEGAEHIGKLLKVKYFELTDDGIPQFPVGLAFRLEEDL